MEKRPPMWDQAANTLHSLAYYNHLKQLGIKGFLEVFYHYRPERAPLTIIIGAIFFKLFGFSVNTATLSNLIYLFILVISVYGIGRKLYDSKVGFLSAFIVSTIPIIAGLSREFLTDYALTAFVALSAYLLIRTEYLQKKIFSLLFGISFGLGMLVKITFPLFLFAPFLYIVILSLVRKNSCNERRDVFINLILFTGCTLIVAGWWYIPNFKYWLIYLFSASYGENISKYWSRNYCNLKDFLEYSHSFMQQEISWSYAFLGIILLLYLFVKKIIYRFFEKNTYLTIGFQKTQFLILVFWAVIPYMIAACSRNRDLRMNIASIPPLGILFSSWVFAVPKRWIRNCFVVLIISIGAIQLIKVSFGFEYPKTVHLRIISRYCYFFPKETAYCYAPESKNWYIKEIIQYIEEGESGGGKTAAKDAINIGFIPDLPRFQGWALQYYLAVLNLPYGFVKVAEFTDGRYGTDKCKYIITKTGELHIYSPWAVKYNKETMEILERSGDFEELNKKFPLPDGSYAIIYVKVKERT